MTKLNLSQLNQNVQDCKRCELHNLPINQQGIVEGSGKLICHHKNNNPAMKTILFIGRNPSYRRFDPLLRAFEGIQKSTTLKTAQTSGDLFNAILNNTKFLAFNVYVTNLIKCSTSENKEISDKHWQCCRNWLYQEIEIIKPHLIILLGNEVSVYFNQLELLLTNTLFIHHIKTITVWHPSYLLRNKYKISEYISMLNSICEKFL